MITKTFYQHIKSITLAIIIGIILFIISCKKEKTAPAVNVQIQNATPSQPIALRLTDQCWTIILPGDTYTYSKVPPLESTMLIAFTDDESSSAYARILHPDPWHGSRCDEEYVDPPYESVKNFSFNTVVKESQDEQNTPTILIIAEQIPGLLQSNSNSVDSLNSIKSGSVDAGSADLHGINDVNFRIVN